MAARRKKAAAGSAGLEASELGNGEVPAAVELLATRIARDGGAVLAKYRDPLGGRWLLFASLPVDKVVPTPFQREESDTHVKRLAGVIPKVGRFLDPLIVVPAPDAWWTPNGRHRLAAMKALGAKSIVALVVPEPEVAFRILALNTEKAHNLKDRSLEVIRMVRALAAAPETAKRPELDWAFEFEEPAYATIGLCYEARPRFAGGAYLSVLKRCEEFSDKAIAKALEARTGHAEAVLELDEAVNGVVEQLKAAGLRSPYLKAFVVARVNPLRWVKPAKPGEKAPRANFDTTLARMITNVKKLDVSKVKPTDLASMAGAAPDPE